MKEATGELSTTVITVVAIAAISSLFIVFLYPQLKASIILNQACSNGPGYKYASSGTHSCDKTSFVDDGKGLVIPAAMGLENVFVLADEQQKGYEVCCSGSGGDRSWECTYKEGSTNQTKECNQSR